MKKLIPLILFIFLVQQTFAQNWQCVRSGVTPYFINGSNYLRGMRIDSAKLLGATDSILYPYHSPRGRYYDSIFLDTTKGSWFGQTITIKTNGTHLFENYWGDTVIIRSQAQLNDTWILFNDTTSIYYKATVVDIDTMTILGKADSIKRIRINAYKGSNSLPGDPLNDVVIIISKTNGFVQVCDLYMFPLHEPNMIYKWHFDYFLDESKPISITAPDSGSIIFHLVGNKWPLSHTPYDYNTGDIYEYELSDYPNPYEQWTLDKVINNNPLQLYRVVQTSKPTGISTVAGNINYSYPTIILDTTHMPEEIGQGLFYYYFPKDSSYCTISDKYELKGNNIMQSVQVNTFEPVFETTSYKQGFGLVYHNRVYLGQSDGGELKLTYASKASNPCGTPPVLGIEILQENQINIYPNPASDEIQIQLPTNDNYNLQMYNAVGQLVKSKTAATNKTSIAVSDLPNGIYYISISGSEGIIYHEQLVIEH